ncbi:LysR family transcriptional regulator [Phyllobacterium sp. 22552]|uniref:LysR family transcriptional regulator n=1 Tax=Phyllobacterium sp. 22552 TaxID=3453941 RepID=UPI003F82A537
MRGSDYAELRAFAMLSEHRSFRRASAHLGMSASALSQTIAKLEARLGVTLVNRTTRSVSLSEPGESLIQKLRPILADLDATISDVISSRGVIAGTLRINTTQIALSHYLAPLLTPLLNAHPELILDITVEEGLIDIVSGGYDAGVRLGEKLHADMVALPISGPQRLMCVAAPAYLDRMGTPETPYDLRHHRCFNYRGPTTHNIYRWEFERDGKEFEIAVDGPIVVNDTQVLVQTAVAGLGVAYLLEDQVKHEVAAGRLRLILEGWAPRFPGFYLYYPSRRQASPALRALIELVQRRKASRGSEVWAAS